MIRFYIGMLIGGMVGISTMCFCIVAAKEDRQLEKLDREKKWKDM